ncbi:MAG: HAD family hydrolase [Candidatus Merdivicinus sp.]|jgi:Cof subfamily protein (haloacid dehalogenase superfamily)
MIPLNQILLVTDCDGTLLRNDKSISRKDLDAISRFVEAGANFTIATGRSLPTSQSILAQLPLKYPIILYNGSMLYDPVEKKPLWMAEIPPAARFVVEKAMEHYGPDLGVEVLTPEALHVLQFTPVIDEHLNGKLKAEYRVASYAEVQGMHWLKVMFALPAEQMDTFRAYLEGLGAEGIRYVRSEKLYFEILPADASKGEALKQLCSRTGFRLEHTVAIGDCDNDLEMLREAGAGYVVANAYPAVRAQARRLTVSNEEGAVSAVIEEILTDSAQVFGTESVES